MKTLFMGKGYGVHSSDLSFGKEFSSSPRGILVSFQGAGLKFKLRVCSEIWIVMFIRLEHVRRLGDFFVDGK